VFPFNAQVKKDDDESDHEELESGAASFGNVEEVLLPIEVKMRNIEQTEAAKRALVEKRKQERLAR
jgi:Hepatocellular carcinoma-associated antigen 59